MGREEFSKIDLSHVLHWPPQPTTMAGVAIIGVGLFVAPEIVWPALVTGLVAIVWRWLL
jgi:hypothetical protein